MLAQVFRKKLGISPVFVTRNIVLIVSSFVWYFLAYAILTSMTEIAKTSETETLIVVGVNFFAIALTAIIGSFIVEKLQNREKILTFWMFAGIFISLIPILRLPMAFIDILIVSLIFGVYFGLGMPATMGYFSASTKYENRARLGGICFLFIALSFSVLGSIAGDDLVLLGIVLVAIRIASLLLFIFPKNISVQQQQVGKTSFTHIISGKSLLLFLVPWLIFSLVNNLAIPVLSNLSTGYEFVRTFSMFESILIAVFALITGFLADSLGRKRLAIIGFAMLGVGYAAVSFLPDFGWYIYTVADGVAWGIFSVLFLFVLWGDLAQERNGEKYYVIGALPYLFSNFMRLSFASFALTIQPYAVLFSFASFFLFVAVLPLIYAPETLPEKVMKDRDLKSYTEKALEKAKKESEKEQKKQRKQTNGEPKESEAEPKRTPEDAEARRLAEKYY